MDNESISGSTLKPTTSIATTTTLTPSINPSNFSLQKDNSTSFSSDPSTKESKKALKKEQKEQKQVLKQKQKDEKKAREAMVKKYGVSKVEFWHISGGWGNEYFEGGGLGRAVKNDGIYPNRGKGFWN